VKNGLEVSDVIQIKSWKKKKKKKGRDKHSLLQLLVAFPFIL